MGIRRTGRQAPATAATMIEARDFVEAARARGFLWYAGVPCSYLTPFINYVLQDASLRYLSVANEGDAVALIAGVTLGGAQRGVAMMQNSGLGNAVSPLTSLTWTFRLPQLLIVTWRGQPGTSDEPQHALMGPVTPQLLELMEVPWEPFPAERDAIAPVLERAVRHMDQSGRPYALLMPKGAVADFPLGVSAAVPAAPPRCTPELGAGAGGEVRPTRQQALQEVLRHTAADATVVLASTGFCGRELYALDDRPNHFYMVGSMGCVTSLALGLALARPDLRVVAIDGDGAALMRMGNFATLGAYGPPNLWHLLLDNGVHDSTGGQASVSPHLSFGAIAAACGYASCLEISDPRRIGAWLGEAPGGGAHFACLATRPGAPAGLPRPKETPVAVRERLTRHLAAAAAGAGT
jgi:phosphonopyruvate decarboxylase